MPQPVTYLMEYVFTFIFALREFPPSAIHIRVQPIAARQTDKQADTYNSPYSTYGRSGEFAHKDCR